MAIGSLKFVLIGTTGIVGASGVVYIGSKAFNSFSLEESNHEVAQTIKDKFKDRLIGESDFREGWTKRLGKLKLDNSLDLHDGLKKIKGKSSGATGEDLKDWCSKSSVETYVENGSLVKGVEKYCTYFISDRVLNGSTLLENDNADGWGRANERLKGYRGELSEVTKEIKNKIEGSEVDSLKEWCTSKYDFPFKHEKDQLLLDVSSFCTVVSSSEPVSDVSVQNR